MPVRDEERTVVAALESLAQQTVTPESLEVLIYDGGSRDRTADVCREFAGRARWRRFEVLENRAHGVQHALNAGLAASRCPWFAVLAGRTRLSPNYLEACLEELRSAGPGVGVGGRFVAEGEGAVPRAIAAVVTHPLGVGSGFRTASEAREVPHHPFAVWRTKDVRRFGGFDSALERNQDDEFSMRVTRRGGRIRLTPRAQIWYRPRERFRGLAVQYFQYGLWKSAVGARRRLFPARSALPAAVVLAAVLSAALAGRGRTRLPLLALVLGYSGAGTAIARWSSTRPVPTAWALAVVHLSYGAGVVTGALRPSLASSRLGRARIR